MTKNIIILVLIGLCLILGFFALNYYVYYEKQQAAEEAPSETTIELGL